MRKWVTFGFIIVLIFVPLLFMGSRDSVEELTKKYVAACAGDLWTERMHAKWSRLTGARMDWETILKRRLEQIDGYEKALIKAGELEERMFVVSNVPPRTVIDALIAERDMWGAREQIDLPWLPTRGVLFAETEDRVKVRFRSEGTKVVVVVAPRKDMARWEKRLRWAEARGRSGWPKNSQ